MAIVINFKTCQKGGEAKWSRDVSSPFKSTSFRDTLFSRSCRLFLFPMKPKHHNSLLHISNQIYWSHFVTFRWATVYDGSAESFFDRKIFNIFFPFFLFANLRSVLCIAPSSFRPTTLLFFGGMKSMIDFIDEVKLHCLKLITNVKTHVL